MIFVEKIATFTYTAMNWLLTFRDGSELVCSTPFDTLPPYPQNLFRKPPAVEPLGDGSKWLHVLRRSSQFPYGWNSAPPDSETPDDFYETNDWAGRDVLMSGNTIYKWASPQEIDSKNMTWMLVSQNGLYGPFCTLCEWARDPEFTDPTTFWTALKTHIAKVAYGYRHHNDKGARILMEYARYY